MVEGWDVGVEDEAVRLWLDGVGEGGGKGGGGLCS